MTPTKPQYLFVYGTLRLGFDNRATRLIRADVEPLGTGEVKAFLYDLGEYPGALKDPEGESVLLGDVFLVKRPQKVFRILDAYEGCVRGSLRESEYLRKKEPVQLTGGGVVEAWIYWYNKPVDPRTRIRQADYLDYLKLKSK